MPATISTIIGDAQTIIGEVAGVGVQQYGEDRVFRDVIRGFNLLFKKYAWPHYIKWYRIELDGTLGIANADTFEQMGDFEDFLGVYRDAEDIPLPTLSHTTNPYAFSSTGTRVTHWTSLHVTDANYTDRRLQFYPKTSEGFLNVCTRLYPLVPPATDFDAEDILHLDRDLLAYAAAFMTLVGDDLNPGAAETVKQFMDMRYKDIINAMGGHRIPIRTGSRIPQEYFTRP